MSATNVQQRELTGYETWLIGQLSAEGFAEALRQAYEAGDDNLLWRFLPADDKEATGVQPHPLPQHSSEYPPTLREVLEKLKADAKQYGYNWLFLLPNEYTFFTPFLSGRTRGHKLRLHKEPPWYIVTGF